jgi:phage terminase large subunit-like protein
VELFFSDILVHTKARFARQPFQLAEWQLEGIIQPVFGNVAYDLDTERYVRVIRIVWLELARKNGKSELLAGIALYLLVADSEESAEVYGCALDRDQAKKVWDVAKRMVELSPVLSKRLDINKSEKRIYDTRTGSYYEVIAADAAGNLGQNPHAIIFDEVEVQKTGALWNALRTGMGSRDQPLMVAAGTAGDDPSGWPKSMHDSYEKVAEDAAREPHTHVFMRNLPSTVEELERLWEQYPAHPELPVSVDPFDEANWRWTNPALGDFLSIQVLRQEALEASNDPLKENAFRQFRVNQWVSQVTRWMPMHLYDHPDNVGEVWATPDWGRAALEGRTAYAGFDLAAKFDLCAWCLAVPDDEWNVDFLWRFWLPEGGFTALNKKLSGMLEPWRRDGWLTVNDGDVVDYDQLYNDIQADAERFHIKAMDGDQWSMEPVIQELGKRTGLNPEDDSESVLTYSNTFDKMTGGLTELMALFKEGKARHHNNPVARWCFDSVEVRKATYNRDLIRPEKPDRDSSKKRIDAVPSSSMATSAWVRKRVEPAKEEAFNIW